MVLFSLFRRTILESGDKLCAKEVAKEVAQKSVVITSEYEKSEAERKTGGKNESRKKIKEASDSERHGASKDERRITKFSANSQNIPSQQESRGVQVCFIIWLNARPHLILSL